MSITGDKLHHGAIQNYSLKQQRGNCSTKLFMQLLGAFIQFHTVAAIDAYTRQLR